MKKYNKTWADQQFEEKNQPSFWEELVAVLIGAGTLYIFILIMGHLYSLTN